MTGNDKGQNGAIPQPPAERIDRFELLQYLGGGLSSVFRAKDTLLGREVAVKVLTDAGRMDPDLRERVLMEARILGNITHKNIPRVFDFREDARRGPFMVMELLKGEDLRNAIQKGHTGDLHWKLSTALQVADAMEYLHALGVIDRDLKPENVFIGADGVVKVLDFGIAKVAGRAITQAGCVLGTPSYMAPEQVQAEGVTKLVDVWAFGALLFEVLTGAKAFGGGSMAQIFYKVLYVPLDEGPMRLAGVPPALRDLVAKCLSKNREERPKDFGEVRVELERLIAELRR